MHVDVGVCHLNTCSMHEDNWHQMSTRASMPNACYRMHEQGLYIELSSTLHCTAHSAKSITTKEA